MATLGNVYLQPRLSMMIYSVFIYLFIYLFISLFPFGCIELGFFFKIKKKTLVPCTCDQGFFN